MDGTLFVHREFNGSYQLVGILEENAGFPIFTYSPKYLESGDAAPISISLPLTAETFSPDATGSFFSGIIPEGQLNRDLEKRARAERGDYFKVLDLVRDEPVGALVLTREPSGDSLEMDYEEIGAEQLSGLAYAPAEVAFDLALESRISLAGAQAKIGLYHTGDDPCGGWYLPHGAAPSTHILKAGSKTFPGETVCEAMCVRAASLMDLSAEECFLIRVEDAEPIIAVKRFDRVTSDAGRSVDGLPIPYRLHQEDVCQAKGVSRELKYEPTGVNYLGLIVDAVRRASTNQMEDRFLVGYNQLFDYAVGNCDNHLKNWSLVWDESWKQVRLAPLYDVLCTTVYPSLVREMGVSFGGSRKIDEVTRWSVMSQMIGAGLPGGIVAGMIADTCNEVPDALRDAARGLKEEGFPEAEVMFEKIIPEVQARLSRIAL
ncbi:MAG: HipA domain-containing protein [Collinsella sp.]